VERWWPAGPPAHFDCFFEAGTLAERGIGTIERSMEKSRSGLKQLPGASLEIGNEVFFLDSRDGMKELAGTVINGLALRRPRWDMATSSRPSGRAGRTTVSRVRCGEIPEGSGSTEDWPFARMMDGKGTLCTSWRSGSAEPGARARPADARETGSKKTGGRNFESGT
jgi:hypothetical protein